MTDLLAGLVVVALIVLAGVFIRELRPHTREAAQLDLELDEILEADDEPEMRDVCGMEPAPAGAGADLRGVQGGAEGLSAGIPAADGAEVCAGTGLAGEGRPLRLTPAQRRRAVKKGRIPRNLLGPSDHALSGEQAHRAGELNLAGQAEDTGRLPGEYHHPRHERIPRPLTIWDPMMARPMPIFPTLLESVAYEAHFRRWEQEMAGMINGAREWLETAA